jgi:hypothetical protein
VALSYRLDLERNWLYGGVLEAILADILSIKESKTLGQLIWEAHRSGFLPMGSRLCALATILLYFRNHIHANKDVAKSEDFVDAMLPED